MAFSADKYTIENLQLIKANYETKYRPFYRGLSQLYPDTRVGLGKNIAIVSTSIESAIQTIDNVLSNQATATEVSSLISVIETINSMHSSIFTIAEENAIFKREIAQIADFVGISKTELKSMRGSSKKAPRKKSSLSKDIRNLVGEAKDYGLLKTILESGLGWYGASTVNKGIRGALDVIGSVLGPAEPLLAPALLTGYGVYEGIRGSVALGRWGAGKLRGKKTLREIGKLPATIGASLGTALSSPINNIQQAAIMPQMSPGASVGKTPFRLLSRRKKEEETEALFYFFDKRAYRAGWTRDVLHELKRIGLDSGKAKTVDKAIDTAKDVALFTMLAQKFVPSATLFLGKLGLIIYLIDQLNKIPGDGPQGPESKISKGVRELLDVGEKHRIFGNVSDKKQQSFSWKEIFEQLNPFKEGWMPTRDESRIPSSGIESLVGTGENPEEMLARAYTDARRSGWSAGKQDISFGNTSGGLNYNFPFPTDVFKASKAQPFDATKKAIDRLYDLIDGQTKTSVQDGGLSSSIRSSESGGDNEDPALTMLSMFGRIGNVSSSEYGWA